MYHMPMGNRMADPEPILVENQEQVDELCAACRGQGRFAFDTEFVMEDRYETEVCLIQVATAGQVWLVDPYLKLEIGPLWQLVCEAESETIVHAGQEDLALCARATGSPPRNVFDVQIAAGLVGYEYPMSLQKLVQAILHIRLHKAKTLTDWRKRPLSGSQLRYAAEDVSYLLAVRDKLHSKLTQRRRVEWAKEEFLRFEEATLYQRVEQEKLFRMKGSGMLKGRELAILGQLLPWRERIAQQRNRPARTVIKDHVLIEIAKLGLTSFSEIRDLRGLNLSDRDVHALAKAAHEAAEIPADQWPKTLPREMESAGETILIALLTAVLRSYSLKQELAYGLLATKKGMTELIRYLRGGRKLDRQEVELLRGWRGKAVGKMLNDVLSGKSSLRVADNNGEAIIETV